MTRGQSYIGLQKSEKAITSKGVKIKLEHNVKRDREGNIWGVHVSAHNQKGSYLGHASFDIAEDGGKILAADALVLPKHQRKGIATAMYNHAQSITGKITIPSEHQSPDAQAFWRKRIKKGESYNNLFKRLGTF
jgi:hypothetical protein